MAISSTISSRRKELWVEPFVNNVQVPGIETTYSAANCVEKFVWVLFLVVFIVLTGYNVVRVSNEYFEAPVVTTTTAVLHKERRPPDMELCLPFDHNYFVFGHSEFKCAEPVYKSYYLKNTLPLDDIAKALDAHLRSVGVTFEDASELYAKEVLKLFDPSLDWYRAIGELRFEETKRTMRTVTYNQNDICLRLLLVANGIQAYDGTGRVHIKVDRAGSTVFPICNSTESRPPIFPPYITLQPHHHNLALAKYARLTSAPGKQKMVRLAIRAEYESDPSGRCEKDAPDIDLCRLECRYRYIRDRCGCRPPLVHRGTQTFVMDSDGLEISPAQYLDEGMRECNATDYFHGDCYKFNSDGAEDEEDLCRRACKPNCIDTQWEFTDEQVLDVGKNARTEWLIDFSYFSYPLFKSEPKLTWFNVLSDIGGALGLFLGLSIFSVIHTLMLPLHLYMRNREAKRKQAVLLNDISDLNQLHELHNAAKTAEPIETETTAKPQGK